MQEIPLQSTSADIWAAKYQLKNSKGEPIDLSVTDSYIRVAKALASQESDPDKWYPVFYEALSNGATPAGRILSNAGSGHHKPAVSLINCTVSQIVEDSMAGIMEACKQSAITLASGAGIGYEFSTLRPKGAFVNGAGSHTSGPITFMSIFDKMCFTVSSAGGRRGAQMGTFAVWHPDVEEFIKAKREDGYLRQFNLSLLITDDFMEAVKSNADWDLFFPLMHSEKEFSDEYTLVWKPLFWDKSYCEAQKYTIENDKVLCKVYKTVKAIDLWDTIMRSTYNFAEPGFLLIDKINEYNNNYFCENVRATNPSMPAGTLVHTKDGVFPIEKLQDKSFLVRSLDGKWAPAKCFLSGKDRDVKIIELSGNRFVRSTPEHRWPVLDRTTNEIVKKYAHEVTSGDLIPLNLALPLGLSSNLDLTEDDGFFLGIFLGGGWLSERKDGSGYAMGISFDKRDTDIQERVKKYLNANKKFESNLTSESSGSNVIQTTSHKFINWFMGKFKVRPADKSFPQIVWESNDNFIRGFVDGLISSDGYGDSKRFIFTSKDLSFVNSFGKLLGFMGVKSSISTQISDITFNGHFYKDYVVHRLNVKGRVHLSRLLTLNHVTCARKRQAMESGFLEPVMKGRIPDYYNEVVSVTDQDSKEDVWDISVYHNEHMFPTEWGYTGNCGEQPLPPEGSCLLGSLNVAKFVTDPFTDKAAVDFDKFRKQVRVFARMLDNVVEMNGLPLEGQREEITSKRRHGMGFTGLGSAFSMLGLRYGSEESVNLTYELMRELAVEGFKEGVNLAIEKGAAPILQDKDNLTKWVNGKYMQRIWDVWPEGKELALKHGCRYTHHSSIAPTGTISLSVNNNVSNGIEPSFSHKYTRNVIVPGKKTKEAVDVYSYEMLLYKHITGKDEVPTTFSTSDTVTTKEHVDIQAAAQYWCDSSISKTINVPTDLPFDEFKNVYIYAYDKGLKGCTTFRFNPEAFQGVLVKQDDLKNTMYTFVLENGDTVEVTGDTEIEYDGEKHTAANLADAIKEGFYGKF